LFLTNFGSSNENYRYKKLLNYLTVLKTKNDFTRTAFVRTFASIAFVFFGLLSCSEEPKTKIGAVSDRTKIPSLHATKVSTVISDSGITRYRITAPQWYIYDKAVKPYQLFPEGIHLERFDINLKVDANIHSLYAKYDELDKTWELKGKVKAINLQGEVFETEQLFWNEITEKIYSDKYIKITQVSHVITGVGFESNQSMTKYTIKNPQGIFPVKDEK
jgi:LPS export ABC transporter protein LptC